MNACSLQTTFRRYKSNSCLRSIHEGFCRMRSCGSWLGKFKTAEEIPSPIILDLRGDSIETITVAAGAHFTHQNDRFAEQTGWVGQDDGLLVRDPNGNAGNDKLVGDTGDDEIIGGDNDDVLIGGEGADQLKGDACNDLLMDAGHDTLDGGEGSDFLNGGAGKGSLQINGQTLEGTFTSYGERGAYRLKLADGQGAGLSVYNDTASNTGKSAILKFSSNLTNQITIRNFDEAAAKGSLGFMGIKIDPKQALLVKASDYATPPNPFQAWDFDPNTFAAGADSSITERNGKSFTVYLQQAASASSTLILNIAGAVGQQQKNTPITTNSIAPHAYIVSAKCKKRFKNNKKTEQKMKRCSKYKKNRPVASVEPEQDAIELVVIGNAKCVHASSSIVTRGGLQ